MGGGWGVGLKLEGGYSGRAVALRGQRCGVRGKALHSEGGLQNSPACASPARSHTAAAAPARCPESD